MAIANFTNFLSHSIFSIFTHRFKHEKISYSSAQKSPELFVSLVNSSALSMISKTYRFRFKDDQKNSFYPLGVRSVVSVVVNLSSCPEIGLVDSDNDLKEFYPIDDLIVLNEVIAIN